MGITNSAPCHGCEDRYGGCHAKCEKYKLWKDEWQKKKEALYGEQKRDRMLRDFYSDSCEKSARKRRVGRKV